MTFSTQNLRNIDIEKLNHFYLVYRSKSITEAARKYEINVKVLRHSLKTIEKKLGTALYYTKTKKFLPTPDGINLYKICEEIVNSLSKFDDTLFQEDKNVVVKQEIIIVTTTTLAHYFLPNIVAEFLREHPNVIIKLYAGPEYVGNNNFPYDILLSSNFNNEFLIKRKVGTFRYRLYCSADMQDKLSRSNDIMDLKNRDLLLFAGDHLLEAFFIKNNNTKVVSNSYPFLLEMCNKGVGILSCFDFKNLKKIYDKIDIISSLQNYYSEVDDTYFYFHPTSDKLELIEKIYNLSIKALRDS